ncbi:MAG: glycosyltransferase family 1 protein [Chitinophagaceae bacterium]|jgi:glycosyltransferase involved in cell wall biosynthesis|nr:glycosyltransferase family 1 protein [Chitinophagaceae bacterium]
MKTIYLHGSPDLYGSGKVLLEILRIPDNAKNAIVVLPHEGPLCKPIKDLNIPLHIVNMGVLRRKYFTPWGIAGRLFLWINAIWEIKKIMQKNDVQLIYVNSLNIIIGPWLKLTTKKTLVWHLHEIIEDPKILFWFLHRLLNKADRLIAVSKAVKTHWNKRSLTTPFHILYNGFYDTRNKNPLPRLTSAETNKPNNKLIIGMVARIQPLKGHSYLLQILEQLVSNPAFKSPETLQLIIAGDPYPGHEHLLIKLKNEIKKRQLDSYVQYIGFKEDITELMENIDVLIVPSIKPDSLPTVVLEAMRAGKPVIATRQGGCLEMIEENSTGYFIPLNDPILSCKILLPIFSDKEQLRQAGLRGKKRAEQLFTIGAFQEGWLNIMSR